MSMESVAESGTAPADMAMRDDLDAVGGDGGEPRQDRFRRERAFDNDMRDGRRRSRSPGDGYYRRGSGYGREFGGRRGGYRGGYRTPSRDSRRYDGGYERLGASDLDNLMWKAELYADDAPLSFGDFVRAVGNDFDPRLVADKYDDYRVAFDTRQVEIFFNSCKNSSWFRERYHPDLLKERKLSVAETYKLNLALFEADYKSGLFEGLTFDETIPVAVEDAAQVALKADAEMEEGEAMPRPTGLPNPLQKTTYDTALRTPLPTTTSEQLHQQPKMLIFKHLSSAVDRKTLQSAVEADEAFSYMALAEPVASRRFNRIGWMALKDDADVQAAFARINNTKIELPPRMDSATAPESSVKSPTDSAGGESMDVDPKKEFELHVAIFEPDYRIRLTAEIASLPSRIRRDFLQVRRVVDRFDREFSFVNPLHESVEALDVTATFLRSAAVLEPSFISRDLEQYDIGVVKQTLDLYLVYLRRVYYFDYYSGRERADSAEEFIRRCHNHHFRRTLRPNTTEENALGRNWARRLDDVIDTMLKGVEYNKLRKLGYKSIESEVEAFVDRHVMRVDDQKYRCKVGECTKLFKGPEFVRKHIANKHMAEVKARETDVEFFNNYVSDGFKLTVADQYRGQNPVAMLESRGPPASRPNDDSRRQTPNRSGRPQPVSYVDLDAPTASFEDIQYV